MTAKARVAALRRLMRAEGLAAYWVPSTDPHQNEYVPEVWKRRAFLTGFTGSAGDAVVTLRDAGLWTDSRYFLQAGQELDSKVFDLHKMGLPGTPTIEKFLIARLKKGQVIGVDPQLISKARAEKLTEVLAPYGIRVRFVVRNLVDPIWPEKPPMPDEPIARHPDRFACETPPKKLARIRAAMERRGADAYVISALDEIAWLLNIRGSDAGFNPVAIGHVIVERRSATLFIHPAKVPPPVARWLRGFTRRRHYREMGAALRDLARRGKRVLVDPANANCWVLGRLKGARLIYADSPVKLAKATKNPAQVRGMQRAHERDGTALVRFLHWLDELDPRRRAWLTETGAAARLEEFRAEEKYSKGPSFAPIFGWRGNGAIVHYDPAKGGDTRLSGRGLLLFDTGGSYLDGTTDVTRTIAIGRPLRREKNLFTRVLQGTIRLSQEVFPEGTSGARLEVVARRPLWAARVDYGHGTGHGVGHYLCVHEGPVGFAPRSPAPLEVGNVLTIEPGHYEAGKFGMRIENMVTVVRAGERPRKGERGWLRFETLTLCPIDRELIEPAMLEEGERIWLNAYQRRVWRTLGPRLEPAARAWLKRATRPI